MSRTRTRVSAPSRSSRRRGRARRSAFARSSSAVSSSCDRKPRTSMPSSDDALTREQQPNGERIGADDPQPRARAAADLRPGAQQHLQTFPRLLAAGEDDPVLPAAASASGGISTPFGTTSYSPGNHARGGVARMRRHGDPVVEPVGEEAPRRLADLHPSERAVRVERRHDRHARESRVPRCRSPGSSARARGGGRTARARGAPDRRARRAARGRCSGSEPFAGTITERPTGITSGGGCRAGRAAGGARA